MSSSHSILDSRLRFPYVFACFVFALETEIRVEHCHYSELDMALCGINCVWQNPEYHVDFDFYNF